jgi:hypothetical protein
MQHCIVARATGGTMEYSTDRCVLFIVEKGWRIEYETLRQVYT